MSPYVEREDSAGVATTAILAVVVIAAVLLLGYFLWYSPTYRSGAPDTDVRVTVPDSPDVEVNPPPVGSGPDMGTDTDRGGTTAPPRETPAPPPAGE